MSKAQQLPLPYIPPEIGMERRYAEQVSVHLGLVRDLASDLRAALIAANAPGEALDTLTQLSDCADDALHFSALLEQAIVEIGRQNDLLHAQRNESLRQCEKLFNSLYACLMRHQQNKRLSGQ